MDRAQPRSLRRRLGRVPRCTRHLALGAVLVAELGSLGCGQASDTDTAADRRSLDKAQLYGDAAMIPTRAGELARRELAIAGELDAFLKLDPRVLSARSSVQLDAQMRRARFSISVLTPTREQAGAADLREAIESQARALSPWPDRTQTELSIHARPEGVHLRPGESWLFALSILGMGFSLGVLSERLPKQLRRPSMPWSRQANR